MAKRIKITTKKAEPVHVGMALGFTTAPKPTLIEAAKAAGAGEAQAAPAAADTGRAAPVQLGEAAAVAGEVTAPAPAVSAQAAKAPKAKKAAKAKAAKPASPATLKCTGSERCRCGPINPASGRRESCANRPVPTVVITKPPEVKA